MSSVTNKPSPAWRTCEAVGSMEFAKMYFEIQRSQVLRSSFAVMVWSRKSPSGRRQRRTFFM